MTAQDLGATSIRFNVRGAGASTGAHDHGNGETADAAAVVDWATRQLGARELWALGFSFGAWIALRLAATRGGQGLAGWPLAGGHRLNGRPMTNGAAEAAPSAPYSGDAMAGVSPPSR